jgi:hypothetical protein
LTPSFMLLAEQCVSDVTSRLKVAVIWMNKEVCEKLFDINLNFTSGSLQRIIL